MKRLWCVAMAVIAICGTAGVIVAQQASWKADSAASGTGKVENKKLQAVQYLFPEQVSVVAGRDSVVDLHFKVIPGMHINSHTPREKSLIATRLIVAEGPGIKVNAVDFPAGSDYTLAALPNDKLSVYSGEFVVRAHIQAETGQHLLEGGLRYQACDTNSCYPPREAPIAVDVIAR